MISLIGRWLIINDDDWRHYHTGQIVESLSDELVVVYHHKPSAQAGRPGFHVIYRVKDLADPTVLMFHSKEEFDAFFKWMTNPQRDGGLRVVSLATKSEHNDKA